MRAKFQHFDCENCGIACTTAKTPAEGRVRGVISRRECQACTARARRSGEIPRAGKTEFSPDAPGDEGLLGRYLERRRERIQRMERVMKAREAYGLAR